MAILLTGGMAAQTSLNIANLCTKANIPFLFASRRGGSDNKDTPPAVRFDWTDPSTYPSPFAHVFPDGETITIIYMIIPPIEQPEKHMIAFVDYAITRGVKRFVLMAGTTATLGGYGAGQVWKHLAEKGVEYAVCRPTWFQENLSSGMHLKTIRDESKIYSRAGDAKVPHVSVVDIGNVAFAALTQTELPNTDYRILGPELLTYNEIAAKLTKILGRRPIEYVNLTSEERSDQLVKVGLPVDAAKYLVWLEEKTAGGFETFMNDTVEKVTGQKPKRFDEFAEENKALWG